MTTKAARNAAVLALVLAWSAPAQAQYFEDAPREGFMVSVAVSGGGYRGFGDIENNNGGGGMLILRVGTKATEALQFMVELDAGGYITKVPAAFPAKEGAQESLFNQHRLAVLGMQYYPTRVFWVRGGLGIAAFAQGSSQNASDVEDETGFGVMSGLGYDVFRRGVFVLDLEFTVTAGIYNGASMLHSGLGLGFNWY